MLGQSLYNSRKWSMPLFIGACTMVGTVPLWFLVNAGEPEWLGGLGGEAGVAGREAGVAAVFVGYVDIAPVGVPIPQGGTPHVTEKIQVLPLLPNCIEPIAVRIPSRISKSA